MNELEEYYAEHFTVTVPSALLMERYFNPKRFLSLCKECVNFGKLWSCPPYDRDWSCLIRNSHWVDLMGTKIVFSQELRDAARGKHRVGVISRRILEQEKSEMDARVREMELSVPGSTAFSSGGCHLCGKTGGEDLDYSGNAPEFCSRVQGKPCRKPDRMRYSLESLGFDVSQIAAELLKTPLLWSGEQLPQYFVLVNALARPK